MPHTAPRGLPCTVDDITTCVVLVLDCDALVTFSPYAELVGNDDPLEPGMLSVLIDTFSMGPCVCECACVRACVHVCAHACVHACVCAYVCVCVCCVCCVCACVCMCVCVCVCVLCVLN